MLPYEVMRCCDTIRYEDTNTLCEAGSVTRVRYVRLALRHEYVM